MGGDGVCHPETQVIVQLLFIGMGPEPGAHQVPIPAVIMNFKIMRMAFSKTGYPGHDPFGHPSLQISCPSGSEGRNQSGFAETGLRISCEKKDNVLMMVHIP
jgi:hypothetical protein